MSLIILNMKILVIILLLAQLLLVNVRILIHVIILINAIEKFSQSSVAPLEKNIDRNVNEALSRPSALSVKKKTHPENIGRFERMLIIIRVWTQTLKVKISELTNILALMMSHHDEDRGQNSLSRTRTQRKKEGLHNILEININCLSIIEKKLKRNIQKINLLLQPSGFISF